MRYLLLALLFVSCTSKKQFIRTYIDEVINDRINIENQLITNNRLNDDITISYRVNEYDTSGMIRKETIADVKKVKTEEKEETSSRQIEAKREVERDIKAELKDKKSSSMLFFWIGAGAALIFVIVIFIAIKFRR